MNTFLIRNATIVNEGESYIGSLLIKDSKISTIFRGSEPNMDVFEIDATGLWLIPGVIDDQVHFREPGLTHKANIATESVAAVAGGITSFMEMPNTIPQTTTLEALDDKFRIAEEVSPANFSFYFGATNNNVDLLKHLNPKKVCGVKVFMGSSTGNMLVDDNIILERIFKHSPVLIATHCEDETTIRSNLEKAESTFGQEISFSDHPKIRSVEACYISSLKAVKLAHKTGARLHILHLSTEKELSLFSDRDISEKRVTAEVCVHHLWFDESYYHSKGSFIKWNPAIKKISDRDALRDALRNNKLDVVATDHAPHTLEEKLQKYLNAPSGGPLVQHSLLVMMELVSQGVFSKEQVVEKMCHNPAKLFDVNKRGFIREGFFADLVLIDPNKQEKVTKENILYKCGWSPFEDETFSTKVLHTFVNGVHVYKDGEVQRVNAGMALEFNRPS